MNYKTKINFYNNQSDVKIDAAVKKYMRDALKDIANEYNIKFNVLADVTFTDEDSIREYNLQNRNIDRSTDVLSFPMMNFFEGALDDDEKIQYELEGDAYFIGDVIICASIAKAQAEEYGHSIERELVYLFVHSILHLIGFDHENDEQREAMRSSEEKIMQQIKLTRDV